MIKTLGKHWTELDSDISSQLVQPEKFGFSQLCFLHIEPYLIDEKLELDDSCTALVLTVALHTRTTESKASVSRKTQRHLQDTFALISNTSRQQPSRGRVWDFSHCFCFLESDKTKSQRENPSVVWKIPNM